MQRLLLLLLLFPYSIYSQLNYEKELIEAPGAKIIIKNKKCKIISTENFHKLKIKEDFLFGKITELYHSEFDTSIYKYFIRNNKKCYTVSKNGSVNKLQYNDYNFYPYNYSTKQILSCEKPFNIERFRLQIIDKQLMVQNWKPYTTFEITVQENPENSLPQKQFFSLIVIDTINSVHSGNSGVYDFKKKKWIIKPNKYVLKKVNNYYIYSTNPLKNEFNIDYSYFSIVSPKENVVVKRIQELTFFNDTALEKFIYPRIDKFNHFINNSNHDFAYNFKFFGAYITNDSLIINSFNLSKVKKLQDSHYLEMDTSKFFILDQEKINLPESYIYTHHAENKKQGWKHSLKIINKDLIIVECYGPGGFECYFVRDSINGFNELDEPIYVLNENGESIKICDISDTIPPYGESGVYSLKQKKWLIKPNYKHTWIDFKNDKFYVGQANKPEDVFLVFDINGKLIE